MPEIRATGAIFDLEKRDRALQNVMAKMHDLAPALFLVNHTNSTVAHPYVENIVLTERGLVFEKMRLRGRSH